MMSHLSSRHIEVQILADQQGHVVHFGRVGLLCSNNQKVLEETICGDWETGSALHGMSCCLGSAGYENADN